MLQYISEIENTNDKATVIASLVGTVNGALVGALSQHIREREQQAEKGGVDGYNDLESKDDVDENDEAPVGTEEHMLPIQVANLLKGVKQFLLSEAESLTFMDQPITGDFISTLDFMIAREPAVSDTALAQLATVLELPAADLKAAHLAQVAEDRQRLKAVKWELVELEAELEDYGIPERCFHELPARYQARLASKAETAIQKRMQRHIQQVLRGNMDAAADVVALKAVQTAVKTWVHRHAQEDQGFADALVA